MIKQRRALTTTALSLIVSCVSLAPAQAAPGQNMDYFANVTPGMKPKPKAPLSAAAQIAHMTPSTNPALGQGSMAMMSGPSPAVTWFESFDTTEFSLQPSDEAKIILKRPFNQEAERVVKWTQTAAIVAHNYRMLAKTMRSLHVPNNEAALKQYQELKADWYNDKASVYEDLIRPRTPARTMEELEKQLKEINDRSESIAQSGKELRSMDQHLRDTYHVHLSRHTDKLYQYVSGSKLGNGK